MNMLFANAGVALALAAWVLPAFAAGPATQAEGNYQQEKARCTAGQSSQDRATCLKEAGAAYEETRRGGLGAASAADLERNATQRCDAQPAADRPACIQRILGAGAAEGSVGGGGLIRETETKAD
jgi:uncharacterized protein YfaQ (DUF2300 family)